MTFKWNVNGTEKTAWVSEVGGLGGGGGECGEGRRIPGKVTASAKARRWE